MPQDDGQPGTRFMDGVSGTGQALDHLVSPEPGVRPRLFRVGMDRRGPAGDQRGAAAGPLGEILHIALADDAVGILQQHAVAGHDNPIGQRHGPQLDGLE